MSDMPAGAGTPDGTEIAPDSAPMWQGSPPGSIYDYVRVASFSLGPDGRVEQWSERAAELLGVPAHEAIGRDPVEVFVPHELRERGHRKVAELLDGREWTGLVPYLRPTAAHAAGVPGAPGSADAFSAAGPGGASGATGPAGSAGMPGTAGPASTARTTGTANAAGTARTTGTATTTAPTGPTTTTSPAPGTTSAAPHHPAPHHPGQAGPYAAAPHGASYSTPHSAPPGVPQPCPELSPCPDLAPHGLPGQRSAEHDAAAGPYGLAEIYLMPTRNEHGERSALCIAVDVSALRQIETDLAASQAVFGQSPLGFFFADQDLRLMRVNECFARAFGRPVAWHRGRTPYDFLPRAEADRFSASLRRVIETGTPVTGMQIVGSRFGETERQRWQVSFYRLHGGSGRPIGVAGLVIDITGRRRAEQEAAGVRRNLALLNEAGARIGTSLDLETTARELLAVAVPQFCDLASVDLYQGLLAGDEAPPELWTARGTGRKREPGKGSAQLRRVAFASAVSAGPVPLSGYPDPDAGPDDLAGPVDLGIPGAGSPIGVSGTVSGQAGAPGTAAAGRADRAEKQDETGGAFGPYGPGSGRAHAPYGGRARGTGRRPVQVGEVHRYPPHSPCATALSTAQVRVIPGRDSSADPDGGSEFGALVQSTLAVPMVARDTVVGLAQFSRTKGSEPFGERDTALAVELAARAAVSIDNARLYRREHERALILQRSLLPPGDPEAAGLDIACRYLPGSEATEVGGDWFDVIELPGHRTALVVGDVMGRGLRAAVAMGELRTAVRTLAMLDLEPAEVMTALDEIAHGLGAVSYTHL